MSFFLKITNIGSFWRPTYLHSLHQPTWHFEDNDHRFLAETLLRKIRNFVVGVCQKRGESLSSLFHSLCCFSHDIFHVQGFLTTMQFYLLLLTTMYGRRSDLYLWLCVIVSSTIFVINLRNRVDMDPLLLHQLIEILSRLVMVNNDNKYIL